MRVLKIELEQQYGVLPNSCSLGFSSAMVKHCKCNSPFTSLNIGFPYLLSMRTYYGSLKAEHDVAAISVT